MGKAEAIANMGESSDAVKVDVSAIPDPNMTPAERIATLDAMIGDWLDEATALIEPKDALANWSTKGREAITIARYRKAISPKLPSGAETWEKKDWVALCADLKSRIQLRVAVQDIDVALFARMSIWADAMTAHGIDTNAIGYHTVRRFFVSCVEFDGDTLSGGIKLEWAIWCREIASRYATPATVPTLREIEVSKAECEAAIKADRLGKMPEDKRLKAEQDAVTSAKRRARNEALSSIGETVGTAIGDSVLSIVEVLDQVSKSVKDHDITLPRVGFMIDPSTATKEDLAGFANALAEAGRIVEIKMLHGMLAKMLDQFKAHAIKAEPEMAIAS